MSRLFILLLFLTTTNYAFSQQINLVGRVVNATSNEPISYAIIQCAERGAVSDEQGRFSLALTAADEYLVSISALGYRSDTTLFKKIDETTFWETTLTTDTLETVIVTDKTVQRGLNPAPSIERLNAVPVILGEADPIKSLAVYPGIGAAREGLTGLHIRGGSDDQNLYLLDGSTIYNPGHLFGFLSVFNSRLVRSVDVYKNYVPAAYGKRLSSAISVHTKQGGGQRQRSREIGILGVNYADVGSFKKNTLSYAGGFRMMHTGLLTLVTLPGFLFNERPLLFAGMYDLNFKLTKRFANNSQLSGSVFSGDDLFGARIRSNANEDTGIGSSLFRYGNRTAALRYFKTTAKGTFTESLFNFTGFRSKYSLTERLVDSEDTALDYENRSKIDEYSVSHRRITPLSSGEFSLGSELRYRSISPVEVKYVSGEQRIEPPKVNFSTLHLSIFSDANLPLSKSVSVELGLRLEHFIDVHSGFDQFIYSPRTSLQWEIESADKIALTYQRTAQPVHAVLAFSGGQPTTYWLPASERFLPEIGSAFSVDYQRSLTNGVLRFSVFRRTMNNLVFLPNFRLQPGDDNGAWQRDILSGGVGEAYGAELYAEKQFSDRFFSSFAYTYSRSLRRFTGVNGGSEFPYDIDRPHDFYLTCIYQNSPRLRTVVAFTYQSGLPVSAPDALAQDYGGFVTNVVRSYNSSRFRPYHRLDLVFEHSKKKRSGKTRTIKFGLYNIYGRPNPISVAFTARGSRVANPRTGEDEFFMTPSLRSLTLFRFLPILSYAIDY